MCVLLSFFPAGECFCLYVPVGETVYFGFLSIFLCLSECVSLSLTLCLDIWVCVSESEFISECLSLCLTVCMDVWVCVSDCDFHVCVCVSVVRPLTYTQRFFRPRFKCCLEKFKFTKTGLLPYLTIWCSRISHFQASFAYRTVVYKRKSM